jgi:hypothetical protein
MEITDIFDLAVVNQPPKKRRDPAAGFVSDFTTWLETVYVKMEKERAPGLHASSLWKTCARQRVLLAVHPDYVIKDVLKAGNIQTFNYGSVRHSQWQNVYLGLWGKLIGEWKCMRCDKIVAVGKMPAACPSCSGSHELLRYEEPAIVEADIGYTGHCDGVIEHDDKHFVFEFKTISPSQFKELDKAKAEHIVQAHAYMHSLKLKDALVVYENKGSQCSWSKVDGQLVAGPLDLKAFHVQFDVDLWNEYRRRVRLWHEAGELTKRHRHTPLDLLAEASDGVVGITLTNDDAVKYERLCTTVTCSLASECPISRKCFSL